MGHSTRLYSAVPAQPQARRAAINVQGSSQQGNASLPALQTILGTAETQITDPATANAFPLSVAIPPGGPCEQEPFELTASGYFNLGTSSTVTLKLYYGSSTTIGSNTLLKSSGALTAFSGKTNWWIKARLIYDSVSGTLTGTVQFFCNNVIVAEAAIATVPTGISNQNFPVMTFSLTVQYGTAGTQIINVKDFGINH